MNLAGRVAKLEAALPAGARDDRAEWWVRVSPAVAAYLAAQDPTVVARFSAHLDWMQTLPGNRDGFRYYQVFKRPWRLGEDRFVPPAIMVWDGIFRAGGRLTLHEAQLCALTCGFGNLCDTLIHEGVASQDARTTAWARLAGGPLCDRRDCLCFHGRSFACRDPAVPVANWRTRGTEDSATLETMGFGVAEWVLLATDNEEGGP